MKLIAYPQNEEIAYLKDSIYQGIEKTDKTEALRFHQKIVETIQTGADLSMVWPRFALQLLSASSPIYQALQKNDVKDSADVVASLYLEWVTTGIKPTKDLWYAAWADSQDAAGAWDAATAAAAVAAGHHARAAGSAAWAAAGAAQAAAWDGLDAAAWDAAGDAAGAAAWLWMRDLLLRLIIEAPGFGDDRRNY